METLQCEISGEWIELFKLLKFVNLVSSGAEAKQLITDGRIKVNGTVETRKAFKVRGGHSVEFDDYRVNVTKAEPA